MIERYLLNPLIVDLTIGSLFWFLFLMPGYAFLIFLKEKKVLDADGFESYLLSFVFSLGLLIPIVLVSYIFELQMFWVGSYFLLLLIVSIVILFSRIIRNGFKPVIKISPLKVIFVIFLAFDFFLSFYVGSFFYGDSMVHLAKINKIIENTISIKDSFFMGLLETRYHVNILHPVFAIPTFLFQIDPLDIWRSSLSFFRLLSWLSFYMLVLRFFKSKKIALFVGIGAIGTTLLFSGPGAYVNYPNAIVALPFFSVFFVFLLKVLNKPLSQNFLLLSIVSLIIGLSHPTYALILVCFIFFFLAILLFLKKERPIIVIKFLPIFIILSFSPLFSFFFPNNMSDITFHYRASEGTIFYLAKNLFALNINWDGEGFATLLYALLVIISSFFVTGHRKIFLLSSVIFPFFILYNPFVFPFFHEGLGLPIWFLRRFSSINIFSKFIVVLIAALLIIAILKRFKLSRYQTLALILGLFPFVIPYFNNMSTFLDVKSNRGAYKLLKEIKSFNGYTEPNKVIAANENLSYIIPSSLNNYVIAIKDDHATPMAKMDERRKSLDNFMENGKITPNKGLSPDYLICWPEECTKIEGKVKMRFISHSKNKSLKLYKIIGER